MPEIWHSAKIFALGKSRVSRSEGVGNNTHFNITLSFGNDIRSQRHKVDDGDEVEVNVRRLVPIL